MRCSMTLPPKENSLTSFNMPSRERSGPLPLRSLHAFIEKVTDTPAI
jgi:hypothetical protein